MATHSSILGCQTALWILDLPMQLHKSIP